MKARRGINLVLNLGNLVYIVCMYREGGWGIERESERESERERERVRERESERERENKGRERERENK